MRQYSPPYEPEVLGCDFEITSSKVVEWLGQVFPEKFTVTIALQDKEPASGLVWLVECEVAFLGSELQIVGCYIGGLSTRPVSGADHRAHIQFRSPVEVGKRWSTSPVQKWQFLAVHGDLIRFANTVFQVALKGTSFIPSDVEGIPGTWATGGAKHIPPDTLTNFSKAFTKVRGYRKLDDEFLIKISNIYQDEVKQAKEEKRKARPLKP